ncbi:MAG: response regulator [Oceanospirillales bacterium]|uniref:LuxR family two component transcriptional regulator n=1 Tax=Marinobacterium halophilum TaxID=267374 RepID=A0A2P8F4L5_9GAMM|nr:response regulator [Marinobacterium halophilum]MBR9829144.1 response regulator [Oceanospirillales bacterium]PSL16655.1 LuxR family two component transcriptional regulator [Marinobacterium halophilum]
MKQDAIKRDLVLVVDDSPDALSLINDVLEAAGMDVLVALEGRQALSIAARMPPDIILLDAVMPHMDGFATCEAFKQDPALCAIPVIFMTGLTETENVVRGLDVGGVDYLTKPIRPDELLARMRVHLNNARLTQSAHSALDTTGQHLLTVAPEGLLQWATPQTHALLARANADELWITQSLQPQLADWLRRKPAVNDQVALKGLEYALSVRLLSHQSNGDYLFKLVDEQRGTGPALLQAQLDLTARAAEVLYWIANGKTNKDIGEILGMSPRTVNKHLEQVYPALGVENRTAAAGVALRIMVRE